MNRITQRGGQRRSCIRVGTALAAVAAIALIAGGKPSEARAADGTTDVTVQVAEGDENLAWSVPTQIPMKATAGGTLIGPDADAIAIRNLSAFPIRVKQMDMTVETPFHLVDDIDKSSGNNDFMMAVNGSAAKQTVELPDDGTWAMGYAGNRDGTDVLPLTISAAKIVRVTEDLSAAKKVATVTWIVEPTVKEVKQDPQPNPENGVAFAVYSDDDKSLDLYKRDRKPEVGDTFNGKTVTKLFDVDETKATTEYYGPFKDVRLSVKNVDVVDSGIKPVSTKKWFYNQNSVTAIDVVKLDVSNVTDMSSTFTENFKLTSLDLSSWDVSNVTDMGNMLADCSSLSNLDLSSWDVSNVTDMASMFSHTAFVNLENSVINLENLSSWDVSSVTNMAGMFEGANLANFDGISSWNTSNVTNMSDMFDETGLRSLDSLSGWNTSNVTDMSGMFNGANFTSLDSISNWDTSNVTDMTGMFQYCRNLTSLDCLSSWDVSSVTNMSSMFQGCYSLTTVGDLSDWDISKVARMESMFQDCSSLTILDLSGWNMQRVDNVSGMFQGCDSLTSLDLSGWCTLGVGSMDGMFQGCSKLTSLDLSGWNIQYSGYMSSMFKDCSELTTVGDISGWDTSQAEMMANMFEGCSKLTVDCSNWNVSNVWIHDDFNNNAPGVIAPIWND